MASSLGAIIPDEQTLTAIGILIGLPSAYISMRALNHRTGRKPSDASKLIQVNAFLDKNRDAIIKDLKVIATARQRNLGMNARKAKCATNTRRTCTKLARQLTQSLPLQSEKGLVEHIQLFYTKASKSIVTYEHEDPQLAAQLAYLVFLDLVMDFAQRSFTCIKWLPINCITLQISRVRDRLVTARGEYGSRLYEIHRQGLVNDPSVQRKLRQDFIRLFEFHSLSWLKTKRRGLAEVLAEITINSIIDTSQIIQRYESDNDKTLSPPFVIELICRHTRDAALSELERQLVNA